MLVDELIERIKFTFSKGVSSDDFRLSARYIYSVFLSTRSLLISREIKKKQRVSNWNYQKIPCIELIEVSPSDCPCLPNKGCDILKFWEQASKDAKRGNKVPILCMRYNSMPAEEFFFVVGIKLGDLIAQYVDRVMYIQVPGNTLMVFMASEVLRTPYKLIHKQAKLILKNS